MCNEQARRVALGLLRDDINDLHIPVHFPEGLPNLEPTDSIRITDRNAILRASPLGGGELGSGPIDRNGRDCPDVFVRQGADRSA